MRLTMSSMLLLLFLLLLTTDLQGAALLRHVDHRC